MFANALLLSTSKMPTCSFCFFFSEGKRKKERREKEREGIRKTIKTISS